MSVYLIISGSAGASPFLAGFVLFPIRMGKARAGDLEISQDLEHEKKAWRVQRIGWVVLGLVWLAGLAGLFGSGPLSGATATGPDLRLEYERFVRYTAPQELTLHLGPGATARPKVRLWVDSKYLESQQIESVVPEPESVEAGPDRMVFVFFHGTAGSADLKDRMKKSQVDEDDILEAARELQGLERLEQIKYAVLERHGAITIIPKEDAKGG